MAVGLKGVAKDIGLPKPKRLTERDGKRRRRRQPIGLDIEIMRVVAAVGV